MGRASGRLSEWPQIWRRRGARDGSRPEHAIPLQRGELALYVPAKRLVGGRPIQKVDAEREIGLRELLTQSAERLHGERPRGHKSEVKVGEALGRLSCPRSVNPYIDSWKVSRKYSDDRLHVFPREMRHVVLLSSLMRRVLAAPASFSAVSNTAFAFPAS